MPMHLECNIHCNTPQHAATRCNTLQHAATHCNTLQHTATHLPPSVYNGALIRADVPGMQHTATHCNTLQHTATHCTTLQHTATHCNTLHHTCHQVSTMGHLSLPMCLEYHRHASGLIGCVYITYVGCDNISYRMSESRYDRV